MASESENGLSPQATRREPTGDISLRFADPLSFFIFLAGLIAAVGLLIYGIRQWTGTSANDR